MLAGWRTLFEDQLDFSCPAVYFQMVNKTDRIPEILQVFLLKEAVELPTGVFFDRYRHALFFDTPEEQTMLVQLKALYVCIWSAIQWLCL